MNVKEDPNRIVYDGQAGVDQLSLWDPTSPGSMLRRLEECLPERRTDRKSPPESWLDRHHQQGKPKLTKASESILNVKKDPNRMVSDGQTDEDQPLKDPTSPGSRTVQENKKKMPSKDAEESQKELESLPNLIDADGPFINDVTQHNEEDEEDEDDEDDEYDWLARVEKGWTNLGDVPDRIRFSKEVFMVAIRQNFECIQYAPRCIEDPDIEYQYWLSKVERNGVYLEEAPDHIRASKEVVMAAIQQNGEALRFAPQDLQKDDKDVENAMCKYWLSRIKRNGTHLQCAPGYIRGDKTIVMAAVNQNGWALQFAPENLRNDKQIVSAAVHQNGWALQFASEPLRQDQDVVVIAVKSNPDAIKYGCGDTQRDPEVLEATRMFHSNHHVNRQERTSKGIKKITLSTRFSLKPSSHSDATNFTFLLNGHQHIQKGNYNVYSPNAKYKQTCDPYWTDFYHPCRGNAETCQISDVSLKTGPPSDNCCWRYSYRYHLEEAMETGGFMLQLVEANDFFGTQKLGCGQRIELDMARQIGVKVFQVYRPCTFYGDERRCNVPDMEKVIAQIKQWYGEGCQDGSDCIIRL